jgi:hypothetical protein
MLLHLRWRAAPVLVPLALLAALPALLVWAAALAQVFGAGHPLAGLPTPSSATTRLERLVLLGTYWCVTLGGPAIAFTLGLLALIDAELHVEGWEITGRVRLPPPPWCWPQALGMLVLLIGGVLFLAMAGHLAADCVLGSDCVAG